MKIISVAFKSSKDHTDYLKLNKVFLASTQYYNPEAIVDTYEINTTAKDNKKKWSYTANTHKLDKWVEIIENADDNLILSDSDMLCRGDLSPGFEKEFDIAYTDKKTKRRLPFNGGVIFIRPTEKALKFVKKWREVNRQMYVNSSFHKRYNNIYGGINQASFGYMLEQKRDIAKLETLPCEIYNNVDIYWNTALQKAKMIHIKGLLRKLVLADGNNTTRRIGNSRSYLKEIVEEWNKWERMIKEGKLSETKEKVEA